MSYEVVAMLNDGFTPLADAASIRVSDDLVHIRVHGLMTLRDLNSVIETYKQVHARHGRLFVLYDVTHSHGIDRAARKALHDSPSNGPQPTATALFGASFALRTMANMIERAMVGLGRPSMGMNFFATEAQARAHIDEQRRRLLNQRGG